MKVMKDVCMLISPDTCESSKFTLGSYSRSTKKTRTLTVQTVGMWETIRSLLTNILTRRTSKMTY